MREFIARYDLDGEQTQKAQLILRQCEARASVYLTGRKADFERLEQRMASVETLEGEPRAAAEREILAQRESLFAPVHEIFEKQLKPRLDRLPTRAQRAKATAALENSTGQP